jgi:hypothetical protein
MQQNADNQRGNNQQDPLEAGGQFAKAAWRFGLQGVGHRQVPFWWARVSYGFRSGWGAKLKPIAETIQGLIIKGKIPF